MKKILVFLCAVLLFLGTTGVVNATLLTNAGFETGDFAGWNLDVPSGATADVVTNSFGYVPVDGNYFAKLKTDGPGSFTTISQDVYLTVGDTLGGWAAFIGEDYMPYNDKAWVQIMDEAGLVIAIPWLMDVATAGDYVHTPWIHWSWTPTYDSDYTLVYGVKNSGDSVVDSYALFDAPVPEPGTMLLLGSGLIGLAAFGRKKFFKKS